MRTSTNKEDPNRIRFYDGRECEIGSTVYRIQNAQGRMRYVIMRTLKSISNDGLFPQQKEYDYYAFCTTYSENLFTDEEIIYLFRKRGQAENYIKENKYGFDLKHYPCLKLSANKAYGLIAAFANNLLRLMALMNNPKKPYYSKNIRKRWICIPCILARGARDSLFRLMKHHYKEISLWLKRIHKLRLEFV